MTTSRDTGTQHKLRMPPELKEKLFSSAKDMNRSLNAEIVARLEQSFEYANTKPDLSDLIAKQEELIDYMKELHKQNSSLKEQLNQVQNDSKKYFGELNILAGLDGVMHPRSNVPLPDQSSESSKHNWQKLNPNTKKKAP